MLVGSFGMSARKATTREQCSTNPGTNTAAAREQIVESGWNLWLWLGGVVSRRQACLVGVGRIYVCG